MKNVVRLLVVFMLIMCSITLEAQSLKPKQLENIAKQVQLMTEVMQLNKEQANTIEQAIQVRVAKIQEALKNHGKGTDKFIEEKKGAMKVFTGVMKETCSKEQLKTWNTYHESSMNTKK